MPPSRVMPVMLPPVMATALAAWVASEPSPRLLRAVVLFGRSARLEAAASLPASPLVTVLAKFGSSPKAAASSFSVSSAPGAASTSAPIALATKAVVASCVVLVPATGVGAVGVPLSAGEASAALVSSAACSPVTCAIAWLWVAARVVGRAGDCAGTGAEEAAEALRGLLTRALAGAVEERRRSTEGADAEDASDAGAQFAALWKLREKIPLALVLRGRV